MKDKCRLCLVKRKSMLPIFENNEESKRLRHEILDCCPIQLIQHEILPGYICNECRLKLSDVYEFREQCRQSEANLNRSYGKIIRKNLNTHKSSQDLCTQSDIPTARSLNTTDDINNSEVGKINDALNPKSTVVEVYKNSDDTSIPCENKYNEKHINVSKSNRNGKSSRLYKKLNDRGRNLKFKELSQQSTKNVPELQNNVEVRIGSDIVDSEVQESDIEDISLSRTSDTSGKQYLCDICSKTYASKSGLRFHLKSHNGLKPHRCRFCDKQFVIPSYKKRHERIHAGDKRFVCHVCSAAFASSNGLKYHLRSHTGEANYRCDTCGKSFRRYKYLKEHVFTHTGERPFACKICGSAYANSGSLFVHEKKCKERCTRGDATLNGVHVATTERSLQKGNNIVSGALGI